MFFLTIFSLPTYRTESLREDFDGYQSFEGGSVSLNCLRELARILQLDMARVKFLQNQPEEVDAKIFESHYPGQQPVDEYFALYIRAFYADKIRGKLPIGRRFLIEFWLFIYSVYRVAKEVGSKQSRSTYTQVKNIESATKK